MIFLATDYLLCFLDTLFSIAYMAAILNLKMADLYLGGGGWWKNELNPNKGIFNEIVNEARSLSGLFSPQMLICLQKL